MNGHNQAAISRGARTFDVAVCCTPDALRRWYIGVLRELERPVEANMRAEISGAVNALVVQIERGDADWIATYREAEIQFSRTFVLPNVPRATTARRALAAVAKAMTYGPGSGAGELIHAWQCHVSYERGAHTTDDSGLRDLLMAAMNA